MGTYKNPLEDKIKVGRKVRIIHTGEIAEITQVLHFYQQAYVMYEDNGGQMLGFSKFEVLEDEVNEI
jgi:hypothetical protein